MQLLYSRATPGPEFLSLSLLLKGDTNGDKVSSHIIEPLLLPSPLSTISSATCIDTLQELHHYLNSIMKASKSKKEWDFCKMAATLMQEDEEKGGGDIQVFHPLNGHGIGLHYRLIKDRAILSKFIPLVFDASKATAGVNTNVENNVTALVLCVGMAGLPSSIVTSPLYCSLSQRIDDCVKILSRAGTKNSNAAKDLLITLLLTEDEDRMTNTMAFGTRSTIFETEEGIKPRGKKITGKLKPKKNASSDTHDDDIGIYINSADQARIMVERLAVLSVAESGARFRMFETRAKGEKSSKKRRNRVADLDGFDFNGDKIRESTKRESNRDKVGGGSESGGLKSGSSTISAAVLKNALAQRDTKACKNQRNQSISVLVAPAKDSKHIRSSGSSGDSAGGGKRRGRANSSGNDSNAFNSYDSTSSYQSSENSSERQSSRDGRSQNFDPFTDNVNGEFTEMATDSHFQGHNSFNTGRADQNNNGPRFQVNVALNEDLTCFYKLSKMSSCSVEGVIQAQVKSNAQPEFPFYLMIRDPSGHIQSIQENRKFAKIVDVPPDHADYLFTVSLPKNDTYFPVMRYKCGPELRPVPIRVQTRVRLEEGYWRVALQISSNPHNEDNLTDLTIIMGVPPMIKGESLTTSPPGGIWNASKRSVIWCVSKLGGGEKFQLQARFEIDHEELTKEGEKPNFPVLVRCQCMYAQLSDVDLEVSDIPEDFPAEVRMKLARRFRLSHRERP